MNILRKINECGKVLLLVGLAMVIILPLGASSAHAEACPPTPWDEIGPFYRPDAPVRSSIGKGYLLSGTVRSSANCAPIPNARIEVWQTGPNGQYDDAHRATLLADKRGRYRLETNPPPGYARRPSHIHVLVDAKGFEGLVTQHYPKPGAKEATFDLVLVPEPQGKPKPGGRVDEVVRPGKSQPARR